MGWLSHKKKNVTTWAGQLELRAIHNNKVNSSIGVIDRKAGSNSMVGRQLPSYCAP